MTKQDIQKIIDSFLEGKGSKASVESVSDGIAKISVVDKCGGGCGCSHEAFDNLRAEIMDKFSEIKEVERVSN